MIHEGYEARKIERAGGISERCELNRQIRRANRENRRLAAQMGVLENRKNAIEKYGTGVIGRDEIEQMEGIGRDMGLYLRQLQREALDGPADNRDDADAYDSLIGTAELLTYITFNNIRRRDEFEEHLRRVSDEEREAAEDMYKRYVSILYSNNFDFRIEMMRREFEETRSAFEEKLDLCMETAEKIEAFLGGYDGENEMDKQKKGTSSRGGRER